MQYDDSTPAVPNTDTVRIEHPSGRGGPTMMDEVASDLALWIDQVSSQVALAFAPGRAPFSANISEEQKLQFYRSRLFNPDGSPNAQGRNEEMARLGGEGFASVYKAVTKRWPELKIPSPPEIEVPEQWPTGPAPAPPGPPPGPPMMPPGPPPGPPMPAGPPR